MSALDPAIRQIGAALRTFVLLTVILGLAYPLAMTGIAQVTLGDKADGSIVRSENGEPVGSNLLGQSFTDGDGDALRQYFQPRPSASEYDPLASGASNLGPENPDLLAAVEERRAAAAQLDGVDPSTVPPDALLASGSALDPHISPEYAAQQVARVARNEAWAPPTYAGWSKRARAVGCSVSSASQRSTCWS